MAELIKAKVRQPGSIVLRSRVVAAIDEFIASCERREWLAAFSSNQFHLAIDDEYRVSVSKRATPTTNLLLYSVPLGLLGLDPWAVELGGGVKDVALEVVAQAVVRAVERPDWWVP